MTIDIDDLLDRATVEELVALTAGRADDSLVAKFVDSAAPMIDYVESATPLRFCAMTAHDYHPEVPGGRAETPESPDESAPVNAWAD